MKAFVLPHLGPAAGRRLGAGDRHRRVPEVGLDVFRPWIAFNRVREGPFTGRPEPALPRQIAQRPGGRPVHHGHDLVARGRDEAGRLTAARVAVQMLLGVPAIGRYVAAAAEGHRVVDDDDLLVVASAKRRWRIQPELHQSLAEPDLGLVWIESLGRRNQQRRLPDQQADVEFGVRLHQHPQLVSDLGLVVVVSGFRIEARSRVELPAQNDDGPLRLGQGRPQGLEIGRVLHQHGEPVRGFDTPAIAARR